MYIFLFIIILILIICYIIINSMQMCSKFKLKGGSKFKLKGGAKSIDLTLEIKNKVDHLIKNSDLNKYSSKIKDMKQLTNKILNKL
uniref:Uncharacterized protein n=1 Tax=viral metagenome TaxID=1070528 RepID=A0A6C0I1V2_9ZZZZ